MAQDGFILFHFISFSENKEKNLSIERKTVIKRFVKKIEF